MKTTTHDRACTLMCAVLIVIMYAIGEPVGCVLFAIFGLYFAFR